MPNINIKYLILIIILSTFGFLIIHFPLLIPPYNNWHLSFNPDLSSSFGDLISGYSGSLFLLANIILLFIVHIVQSKSEFEKSFYLLLQIHRDNVNDFTYCNSHGRKAIHDLIRIYDNIVLNFLNKGNDLNTIKEKTIISYLALYYGYFNGKTIDISNAQRKKLFDEYKTDFSNIIWNVKGICKEVIDDTQYLMGYNIFIDPLLNHLFDALRTIDQNSFLSRKDRHYYTKLISSQLSIPEKILILIHFHSFSNDSELSEHYKLFEKYDIISKIPDGYLSSTEHLLILNTLAFFAKKTHGA